MSLATLKSNIHPLSADIDELKVTSETHTKPVAPAIQLLSAEKVYPNQTRALQPVDLTIQQGEFVTLLGPSGCGKSTLLKMVSGLEDSTDGKIRLWHQSHDKFANSQRTLSYVFQEASLMPWHTVRKNVRLPLELEGMNQIEADKKVDVVLKLVGLEKFSEALPRELSGGMQMRVSIARGLVVEPHLLLMDEPFGALDEITRFKLDSELLDLWKKHNLTVMFVTHSIHEAVFLSERIIVMAARPGRVIADIKIDEPFPRTQSFRMSEKFSHYAMQLHDCLINASE